MMARTAMRRWTVALATFVVLPHTFGLCTLTSSRALLTSASPKRRQRCAGGGGGWTMQIAPEWSKYPTNHDPDETPDGVAFRNYPNYRPSKTYEGTMKPGTTPENYPLSAFKNVATPHQAPYFQEVPFHIRWPAAHPAPIPIMQWLEDNNRVLTQAEEDEIDSRGKKMSARGKPKKPNLVSPEDIQDELLGSSNSDEALMAEALGVLIDKPEAEVVPATTAPASSDVTKASNKPKKNWTADKNKKPQTGSSDELGGDDMNSLGGDESLLDDVLRGLDFTDSESQE